MTSYEMTPHDMLGIRNKVDAALKAIGWEFSGGGVSLVDPEADLQGKLNGEEININIRLRDQSCGDA